VPKSQDLQQQAEIAIEDTIQSLRDALKMTDRADYTEALNYVLRGAMPGVTKVIEKLLDARETAEMEEHST
jgi:hypothetical protein